MKTTIYLLRHGDYENPKHIFHGRLPGFPLSQKGLVQVKKLGELLSQYPITAVYASPLTRTFQTAQAIAAVHNLPVETDDRLMDLITPLQGKPISYMESIDWNFFRPEFIKQGGEPLSGVFKRMDACIREKIRTHPGEHIVFVSHGDPVMAIKTKYLGGQLRGRKSFSPYVRVAGGIIIRMNQEGMVQSVSDFPNQKTVSS